MTVLKLEGISAGYADSDVIHGVDLAVEPGDFTCLLGSNNAGKSTLINCISGLVPARGGRIHFNDADITRMAPYQRAREGLIQVPEGRQLFSEMTVHENILLGAGRAGPDPERLNEAFALFPRVKERRNQLTGSLSGGEQQMVAIARGLMGRPKLLMLDEPSLGLAPLIVEAIFNALTVLNQSGVTILLVEQNLHVSLAHARFAYVLQQGRVVTAGTADALRSDPTARMAYLGL